MTNDYRGIWKESFGEIPKDEHKRSYEIHHIDGDHENNVLSNLECLSIDEHYDKHFSQGDYAACHLIAKRKAITPQEASKLVSDLNRLRVGDKNPFFGKKHTQESRDKLSAALSGDRHPFFGKKRPEFAKKVSAALKGRSKTPEHCAALSKAKKGKATKQFSYNIIINGVETVIVNLKNFCRENSLPYHKIRLGIECNGHKLLL